MNDNNYANYSFIDLFDKNLFDFDYIEIPIIQRDYAQGRESAKEIRKKFITKIMDTLKEGKKLHLDFIYGSVKDENGQKKFIPLDGQQRLTTLFLLHWYFAQNEDNQFCEFQRIFAEKENSCNEDRCKSKFTYEIRESAREFCNSLVTYKLDLNSEINDIEQKNGECKAKTSKISDLIRDQHWYFLSWKYDPTIQGMLNMLDTIHNILHTDEYSELLSKKIFQKLIEDNPITFNFLELKDLGITDDELYIRMNARGKLLTDFENFKAKFEKIIKCYENSDKSIEICKKFDNEYLDVFWKLALAVDVKEKNDIFLPQLADKMFENFLYNFILNLYIKENNPEGFNKRDDFIDDNPLLLLCEKVYPFNKNLCDEVDPCNNENYKYLISFLEYLSDNYENLVNVYKKNNDQGSGLRTVIDVIDVDKNQEKRLTYWDRVRFYAFCVGVINHNNDNNGENCKNWYRILRNLVNNTMIDSIDRYHSALKAIDDLSSKLNEKKNNENFNILNKISQYENTRFVDFFQAEQQKEEIRKAKLILKDIRWKDKIIDAENYEYLNGKIGFLLDFSREDINEFEKYWRKFKALWDFTTKGKQNQYNQYLVYQALLTKGDYLPQVGSNKTFCSFKTTLRDKLSGWFKVFDDQEKREIFKSLLDEINIDNIVGSLQRLIQAYQFNYDDWKSYFIKNIDYLSYCKELQLRFDGANAKIYLLSKLQMNSYHRELHSWHFFLKQFKLKEKNRIKDWRLEGENVKSPYLVWYEESCSYDEPSIVITDLHENNNERIIMRISYEPEQNSDNHEMNKDKVWIVKIENHELKVENYELKFLEKLNQPSNKIDDSQYKLTLDELKDIIMDEITAKSQN